MKKVGWVIFLKEKEQKLNGKKEKQKKKFGWWNFIVFEKMEKKEYEFERQ